MKKVNIQLLHPITDEVLYSEQVEYDVYNPDRTNRQINEVKTAYLNLTTITRISEVEED